MFHLSQVRGIKKHKMCETWQSAWYTVGTFQYFLSFHLLLKVVGSGPELPAFPWEERETHLLRYNCHGSDALNENLEETEVQRGCARAHSSNTAFS